MDKAERFNFNNPTHISIFHFLWDMNKNFVSDDIYNSAESMLSLFEYYQETFGGEDFGFIYFCNDIPYGILAIDFDSYKNANLHSFLNIYTANYAKTKKILLGVIDNLFQKPNVNKIKATVPIDNVQAEMILRLCGFKKSGIEQEEILKNGKRVSVLNLRLLKSETIDNKHILDRKNRNIIVRRLNKNGQ